MKRNWPAALNLIEERVRGRHLKWKWQWEWELQVRLGLRPSQPTCVSQAASDPRLGAALGGGDSDVNTE